MLPSQARLPGARAPLSGASRQLLLRLAAFCGAPRRALAKTGAQRQRRLPASSTGRGRRRCPRGGSQVYARRTGQTTR